MEIGSFGCWLDFVADMPNRGLTRWQVFDNSRVTKGWLTEGFSGSLFYYKEKEWFVDSVSGQIVQIRISYYWIQQQQNYYICNYNNCYDKHPSN